MQRRASLLLMAGLLLAVGLALFTHFAPNGVRANAPAAPPASTALPPEPAFVELNRAPSARPASAPIRAPAIVEDKAPALVIDSELADPIPEESSGLFKKLHGAWEAQPSDSAATSDAESFFRGAFAEFKIHAESAYIRCGATLCRGRFRFEDLKELYKMNQIDNPDGVKIATTFPVEEGASQSVSIYWTRNPNPEGPLTETAGQ